MATEQGIRFPGKRLAAAAEFVAAPLYPAETKELFAIDIGADHARLAIYLIRTGICARVIATDLRDGPTFRAAENIRRQTARGVSLSRYIKVIQTDGFAGLESYSFHRAAICGMGGEGIRGILERAPFLREPGRRVKLVLQPQSREYELREYLYRAGYRFIDEVLVREAGYIYPVMAVTFDAKRRQRSNEVLLLGEHIIKKRGELFEILLERRVRSVRSRLLAKRQAGLDTAEDKRLLARLFDLCRE